MRVTIEFQAYPGESLYPHPNGPQQGPGIEITKYTKDGREQTLHLLPPEVVDALEHVAEVVAWEDESK